MVRVYKNRIGQVNNPERFFNLNISSFDLFDANIRNVLYKMERAEVLSRFQLRTPYGQCHPSYLKISTKLALCMLRYPAFLFEVENCGTKAFETILNLPDGNLLLSISKPLEYYFPIRVMTEDRKELDSSTLLNAWLFGGGECESIY